MGENVPDLTTLGKPCILAKKEDAAQVFQGTPDAYVYSTPAKGEAKRTAFSIANDIVNKLDSDYYVIAVYDKGRVIVLHSCDKASGYRLSKNSDYRHVLNTPLCKHLDVPSSQRREYMCTVDAYGPGTLLLEEVSA